MFFSRKKETVKTFDRAQKVPVIRSSICTGERVAGFKDKATGHFEEIMCLRSEEDQKRFLQEYGIAPEEIRKEW